MRRGRRGVEEKRRQLVVGEVWDSGLGSIFGVRFIRVGEEGREW